MGGLVEKTAELRSAGRTRRPPLRGWRWVLRIVTDNPFRDAAGLYLIFSFDYDREDGFAGVASILERLQGEAGTDFGASMNR
jgi:hypothetical protein